MCLALKVELPPGGLVFSLTMHIDVQQNMSTLFVAFLSFIIAVVLMWCSAATTDVS